MHNARNELMELLQALGWPPWLIEFEQSALSDSGGWACTATLALPGGPPVVATADGWTKAEAAVNASAAVLEALRQTRPDLWFDWDSLKIEAQAGDAFLKLAAYSARSSATSAERSLWLQRHESNAHLAQWFEAQQRSGIPELPEAVAIGPGIGVERQALLAEALIWRRYGGRIRAEPLAEMAALLDDVEGKATL